MRDETRFYIAGAWVAPLGSDVLDVINPATEKPAGRIALGTSADVDRAVAAAKLAFTGYSLWSVEDRIALLERIGEVYKARMPDLAAAVTEEMGAPAKFRSGPRPGPAMASWPRPLRR